MFAVVSDIHSNIEALTTVLADIEKRGITWEMVTATALLESGADILVLRHPETIGVIRDTIDKMMAH